MSGTLYIVATPIGNLEDITLRALRVFKEVDLILAEDTRRTQPLLQHYGISKKTISYFEYSKDRKTEKIIDWLNEGQNIALVTDGGTPGLSDPGARLAAAAWKEGISVVPVPGASAVVAALSVAGLPTEPLHFWGFLSPKNSKRKRVYDRVLELDGCHCFYESPHKILKRMEEWKEYFPDFWFLIAKEISKKFETFWRGKLETVMPEFAASEIRGEYTVLLSRELLVKEEKEEEEGPNNWGR